MVSVRLSPDGRRAAALTSDGSLRFFSLETPRQPGALERVLRNYKYRAEQGDFVRDEEALRPPSSGAKPVK